MDVAALHLVGRSARRLIAWPAPHAVNRAAPASWSDVDVDDDRPARGALFAGLVLIAIAVEVVSGMAANSPVPGWAERVVPLGWPDALRGLWWLAVAGAAARAQWLLRAGRPARRTVAVMTATPFLAFAVGSALGLATTSWH